MPTAPPAPSRSLIILAVAVAAVGCSQPPPPVSPRAVSDGPKADPAPPAAPKPGLNRRRIIPEPGQTAVRVESVTCLAFSPDGDALATGHAINLGSDGVVGAVRVWPLKGGGPTSYSVPHAVNTLSYRAPDGILAAAVGDRIVDKGRGGVYLIERGEPKPTVLVAWDAGVQAAAFAPSGKTLAWVSGSGVYSCNVDERTRSVFWFNCSRTFDHDQDLTFSRDGKRLATRISVYDISGPAKPTEVYAYWNEHNRLRISPDGRAVAVGYGRFYVTDGDAFVHDLGTGKDRFRVNATDKNRWVRAVAFSPDGGLVAVGYGEGAVTVHDAASGAELLSVKRREDKEPAARDGYLMDLAFGPDGKTLAAGLSTGYCLLWDVVLPPAK